MSMHHPSSLGVSCCPICLPWGRPLLKSCLLGRLLGRLLSHLPYRLLGRGLGRLLAFLLNNPLPALPLRPLIISPGPRPIRRPSPAFAPPHDRNSTPATRRSS